MNLKSMHIRLCLIFGLWRVVQYFIYQLTVVVVKGTGRFGCSSFAMKITLVDLCCFLVGWPFARKNKISFCSDISTNSSDFHIKGSEVRAVHTLHKLNQLQEW